jgi:predicted PurR-regulated permease PerM
MRVQRGRLALWLVAVALFAAVAYVAWRYVGTVVLGLFVYYVTRPVFQRIHARVDSRTLAVFVSLLTVAMPVLVLVGWTLTIAVRSLSGFFSPETQNELAGIVAPYVDVSAILATAVEIAGRVIENPGQVTDLDLGPYLSRVADAVVSSLGVLFNAALHAFIVLIIAFYLLRDDYRIARWARETFVNEGGILESYFRSVDTDLKNVYFGNILNALVTGILGAVTYVTLNNFAPGLVRIPEPALVGLLAGAGSLVPVIGIKVVTVPVAIYLFVQSAIAGPETIWFPVVFAVVSFVVVDYVPDQLLRPYVSGRTLHVGAVMLAYTLGPLLFGWYGIFLGPLVLVVVFEFARVVVPWLSNSGADVPDRAPGIEPSDRSRSAEDAQSAAPVSDPASGRGEPGDQRLARDGDDPEDERADSDREEPVDGEDERSESRSARGSESGEE